MNEREEPTPDEPAIAELLRNVGARSDPSFEVSQEVEAAVRAEWLAVVASSQAASHRELTRRRRRAVVWAAAASICALGVGAVISTQLIGRPREAIASAQRVEGDVFIAADDSSQWLRMNAGQRVAVGNVIRSEARAALRLDNGIEVRVDRGTSFEIIDDDRFELTTGALYVDSHPNSPGAALTIETLAGAVSHLGTQYQVRARVDGVDVSVREGRVIIQNPSGRNVADAGELLEISLQGSVQRSRIAPTDEHWRWAREVAPAFAIENESLAAFLDWVARETGRALVYESARARSTADAEILHGSIEGLEPDVALNAVLATTSLRWQVTNPQEIKVGFAAPIDPSPTARPTP